MIHNEAVFGFPTISQNLRSISDVQRSAKQALARRITQRRLLHGNKRELHHDGSNLIFRGKDRMALWDVMSTGYNSIAFLNDHDVVLASDVNGHIDVVRLPRYSPPCDEDEIQRFRPLGKQLAGRLCTTTGDSVYEPVKLKSLMGGHAFAAGMPNGEFRVFATEHASTWGDKNGLESFQVNQSTQSRGLPFIRHGWQFSHSKLVRESPNGNQLFQSTKSCCSGNLSRWDSRETPSSLLVAHASSDSYNCLSLQVMDSRQDRKTTVIGLQRDSLDGTFESVTSVCFASDKFLATAHEKRHLIDQKATETTIKWWDTRMIRKSEAAPTIEKIIKSQDTAGSDLVDAPGTRLTPSAEGVGSLMLTSIHSSTIVHEVFEPTQSTPSTQVKTKNFLRPDEFGDQFCSVTRDLDFLVSLESKTEANRQTQYISLYDFAKKEFPNNRCVNRSMGENTATTKKQRVGEDAASDEERSSTTGTIPLDSTKDRFGIRTSLKCVALNDSGSALVGGSVDGDLFLWRGV